MEKQKFLDLLNELVSIESVALVDIAPGAPFGKGPAKALDYMLSLCESFGFRVKKCGDMFGWAEIGEGDELVAVLCHLDVVPAGEGWEVPPFALTIKDDRVYGRGVMDDKGPALSCVAAMKELLDEDAPLKRRIRIIFGCSEETGEWVDMAYYREHEEKPAFGITPDGDYPAIYGEKGLVQICLSMPLAKSGFTDAFAGSACNVVPSAAEVSFVGADGAKVTMKAEGRSAHASMPQDGSNAISALMEKISALDGVDLPFVDFYEKYIGWDLSGTKMGCGFSDDKSGGLTLNAAMLRAEDEDLDFYIDIRYPVTYTVEDVLSPIKAAAGQYGMSVEVKESLPPIYMDKNGPVIEALLDVYHEMTFDKTGEAIVIGGATYARSMDNIVAFGPVLPGRELTEHMANEYVLMDDLFLNIDVYREALRRLANL